MTAGFYDVGGFSTVMEQLAINLVKKGCDVTIGALSFRHFPSVNASFDYRILPINNFFKLKNFLDSFDIVHNHHSITNYLSWIGRGSFVSHYHGSPSFNGGELYRLTMFSSILMTKNRFDATIAISEVARMELNQLFGIKDATLIYNGVDTEIFRPELQDIFRKGYPQFLFVGNLYSHKNVSELVLAIKEVARSYPTAHLQIIGEGVLSSYLNGLIKNLQLEKNIELLGRVPLSKLPYYYASCDVYVTASRWELFGLPLLEAMACGKPVVASSIFSHEELIRKSGAGEIYTLGNVNLLSKKMIKVYENSANYKGSAINFARKHNWFSVADELMTVYNRILKNTKTSKTED